MWGRKKPDERQAAMPEPKNLQENEPAKPSVASSRGNAQVNERAVGPTGAMKSSVAARLGANLRIKGEITGSEDLMIDGTFEGLVLLDEGKLTIGPTARVTADIVATEVAVSGNLKGNVRAKNRIEIKKDGSVTGDLTTPQILIEDGAFFQGSIEIDGSVEKGTPKSASSQAASTSTPPKVA
ncbi:MAG: polymer-forming cytoskeletal protein [Acidobacteria bacterium]|nr:MAG: polymer-forming cytoskeletal protein [Acidobacteriota bacterium]